MQTNNLIPLHLTLKSMYHMIKFLLFKDSKTYKNYSILLQQIFKIKTGNKKWLH